MILEFTLLNTITILYFGYILYLCKTCEIKDDARHHIISHNWILVFLVGGVDGILYYNKINPYTSWVLIYGLIHTMQHLTKENIRLSKTNDWVKND